MSGAVQTALLDASGNLGLGVTPSAWYSGVTAIQMSAGSLYNFSASGNRQTQLINNAYLNASAAFIYQNTDPATRYAQTQGQHQWFNAASGTAGNTISFTQAMTLDASGRLGIGTTSPTTDLSITNSSGPIIRLVRTSNRFEVSADTDFMSLNARDASTYINFKTADTERARITSGGDLFLGATTSALNGTRFLSFTDANQSAITARCTNGSQGNDVLLVRATRNTTNGSYNAITYYNDGAGAYRFMVADSGNVTNTNGSYGTISDAKMKTDIVDAGSQWADIKAIKFRKFKMKDDPSGLLQLGVVAQELEQTSPGLVEEHSDKDAEGNDLGTTTKSVKTSVLLMKAAVALQEAMARIETLEAKIAALEAK